MAKEPLRARIAAGERIFGTMAFEFFTPGLPALLEAAGCQFMIVDMEHSGAGIETVKQQVAYARGLDIEVWVRPPEKSYAAVATVLDAGATGIMVPMLETAQEAHDLVEWAKYRPEGKRGCAFGMPHDSYRGHDPVAYMAEANKRITLLPLIETVKGLANVDAILAVPGIDIGWVGHFDLTNSMGITAQFDHPDFLAALDKVAAAAKKHGKATGFAEMAPNVVDAMVARGFRVISWGVDTSVMRTAMRSGMEHLRKITAA